MVLDKDNWTVVKLIKSISGWKTESGVCFDEHGVPVDPSIKITLDVTSVRHVE